MASSRVVLASLLLLLVLAFHVAEPRAVLKSEKKASGEEEKSLVSNVDTADGLDCGGACAVRCSKSSRPKLCKRACGTCCSRCRCVPPGTYGNYDVCPCYAALTTHGNRRKCP